jgi:G patch domain/KOW motif-containing protein
MLEKKKRDLQVTLQVGSIVRVKKKHGHENGQADEEKELEKCCHDERAKVIQTAGVPGLNRIMIQYEGDGKPIAVKKSSVVLVNRSDLEKNPFEEMVVQGGNESTTTTAAVKNNHRAGPRYETKREQEKRNDKQDNDNRHHHHHRHHQGHDQSDQDNHRSSSKRRYEETVSSTSSRRDNHPHRVKNDHKRPYHDISTTDHHCWLIPNIRVRVVTKKIAKGRQFREKGIVLDVLRQGREATIQMSNGDILERIPERYLETALPKAGGNVIVLTGTHKYDKGKLLERNSDKGRGVVQLYEDMNVVTLSLDNIAEYCAPLDDTLGDY